MAQPQGLRVGPRTGGEEGQTLAEFALILLVFMLIIMGIVDLSRAIYIRSLVANAAREGARYGVVHPDRPDLIEAATKAVAAGVDRNDLSVGVQETSVVSGTYKATYVTVVVSCTYHPMTVMIARFIDGDSGAGLVLRGRSRMRVE